jgi:DNA-binding beta-propeller fold protein YncE
MKQPSCGRWPLMGRRLAAALAATSCLAVYLLAAAGAATATASPGPVQASRFGVLRPAAPARPVSQASAPSVATHAAGSIVLSGSPGSPAANPKTGTVYVPIQCVASHCRPATPAHVVDVVNAAKCNAKVHADCRVVATIRVGRGPLGAVVDQRTDTIYVTNGNDGTVSVINGARCNAKITRGCRTAVVATIKVGTFPVADAFNPATRTVYVANLAGSISVINAATCNARTTRGCHQPVRTVKDKAGPAWIDIDGATDTVYVANGGTSGDGGDTVSVIDGATCNGHTGRGCGRIRASITVGLNPLNLAVDQATGTVYVANADGSVGGQASVLGHGSVSVINGARCNAKITSGCGRTPPAVPTGIGTGFVVVDDALHTVFAVSHSDDTMSAINTRTCGGTVTAGCSKRPPNQQARPTQGPGFAQFPTAFALIRKTGTAYVMDEGGANTLSIVSISKCNAMNTSGCRREAPSVPDHDVLLSEDPATGTIYAGNASLPQIDVISAAACHAKDLSGCAPVATIPMPDPQANVGAIDHATHTLYAADEAPSGTLAVINTAACNAEHTAGCAQHPPMIKIGTFPNAPVINPATHTVYLSYGNSANKIAVVNAATCNAGDTAGCGQTPAVVKVGKGTFVLAVSRATDTVYAPASGLNFVNFFNGHTVAVINGATCDGTDHSGCRHLTATIKTARRGPFGVTVDDHTHTVYVTVTAGADRPGTVAVINGATCNGTHAAGCHGPFPVMPTSATPQLTALDRSTGILYVTNLTSADVTELSTVRCNATTTSGCRKAGRVRPVGSGPGAIAVDPHTNTIYITSTYQAGSISIFAGRR